MTAEAPSNRGSIRSIFVRDYVLSFLALFGFLSAYLALTPTLPLYLEKLQSSAREIGLLVGTIGISALAARFLVGRVLRKYSERALMISGAILFTLSFFVLIVFRPFWPFFFARVLQGIAFASLDTAAVAYVVRIIPPQLRARALSYFLLAPSLASAIAASSAVFVVNSYGFTVLLLACAAVCLCVLFLSSRLKQDRDRARAAGVSVVENRLFVDVRVLPPAIFSFLVFFAWAGVAAFFPLYAVRCGVSNPGFFFSASAAMVIAVRLLGGKLLEVFRKEELLPILMVVYTASLVLLAASSTLTMFILVGLLWGIPSAFLAPLAMSYALEYSGSSDSTTVGTYQAFMDLGLALGPVTAGIIVPFTGYRIMFLCLAFACLINLGYFQLYLRRSSHHAARRALVSQ
jgi:MFS family permease